jgi:hypothetical protein
MVVDFIESQPGLLDMCGLYPEFVATYAPQLTITGNGGTLESTFETCLQRSLEHHAHLAKASPSLGTALTSDGNPPLCDKWIAWRHPTLGNYTPAHLACQFVQGELGGPSPQEFATVDYLVWLLAESSSWLPSNIRATLLEGMRDWSTWLWGQYPTGEESELGLKGYPEMGALQVQIFKAKSLRSFRISAKALKDIESRFEFSRDLLGIGQPLQELVESFCAGGFVDKYVRSWVRRNTKRKQKRRP